MSRRCVWEQENWALVEHHQKLAEHPNFQPMLKAMGRTMAAAAPPKVLHITFNEQSRTLDQLVILFIWARVRADSKDTHDQVTALFTQLSVVSGGLGFGGQVVEDPSLYCFLLGGHNAKVRLHCLRQTNSLQ